MTPLRSMGFWPGTFLGALLGLVLAHGFLGTSAGVRGGARPQRDSMDHSTPLETAIAADGDGTAVVDPDADHVEICRYSPAEQAEALTALVSGAQREDDGQDADSTFEQLLKNHVLSTYSGSMGSRCSPEVKFEAAGRPVLAADVTAEGFGRSVNAVPTSTGKVFSRGRVTLDDLYRSVLDLSRMAPGTLDMGFTRTKASALRELAKSERASDFGPEKYYAATPIPRDWSTNDTCWSAFSMDYINKHTKHADASTPLTTIGQLTFEYCIVGIERPWFSDALFRSHTRWCMPHMAIGQFSEQHDLKLLPVAMVVVRKLSLKLDPAHAAHPYPRSIYLEPTTLTSGTWSLVGGQLVNPTKQVVAWICLPLPPIPPTTAPGSVNALKEPLGRTQPCGAPDPYAAMVAARNHHTTTSSIA